MDRERLDAWSSNAAHFLATLAPTGAHRGGLRLLGLRLDGLLRHLLLADRGTDLLGGGLDAVQARLLLGVAALLVAAELGLSLHHLADDALLLHEEGAHDAVADLVVREHTAVRAGDAVGVAGLVAAVEVVQRLRAGEALVAH